MADLLTLVDTLIGDNLAGNVYSNQRQYSDVVNVNATPTPSDVAGNTAAGGNAYTDSNTYSIPSYGLLRTLDISAIANWMRNVGKQVYFGASVNTDPSTRQVTNNVPGEVVAKSTAWLASQFLLASMNPGDPTGHGVSNMIWNPLSFFTTAVPGSRGTGISGISPTGITVGAIGLFGTYKSNVETAAVVGLDRLNQIRAGIYAEVSPVHRLSQIRSPVATPGFAGDLTKPGDLDTLQQERLPLGGNSVQGQVDGGVGSLLAQKMGLHTNPYSSENPYGPNSAVAPLRDLATNLGDPGNIKLSSLFKPSQFPGGTVTDFGSNAYNFVNKVNPVTDFRTAIDSADAPGLNAATTDANLSGEYPDTALIEGLPIEESQIYMPFMFQDLRDGQAPNEKFLYFRAFLKDDLTETFTPDWQTDRYYGRVDEIPTYLGTSRIINFSFDVVAWSPQDLAVIYKKLHKLQSMVYPSYNVGGYLSAAPIIRLRIGDLIAGFNNRGLPGYITSLDFAYDDGIWNIDVDEKVPRKISVAISYTVLHDGNPGIYPYSSAEIFQDGSVVKVGDTTFGAGKFTKNPDGTFSAKMSVRDIRKIFGSVSGITT